MAPRHFWTGYLKLSLVTCPVALTPATSDAERVRFHTLNRRTGNRVVKNKKPREGGSNSPRACLRTPARRMKMGKYAGVHVRPMSGRGLKRLMALPCRASETPRLAAGP